MPRYRSGKRLVLFTLMCSGTGPLIPGSGHASSANGVDARPLRTVFEPAPPAAALRVQIHGVIAVATDDGLSSPASCGYLYYSCKTGEEALCREQWNEIAAAAAGARCVRFGARRDAMGTFLANGRLRPDSEVPTQPDPYIVKEGLGVMPWEICPTELLGTCSPAPAGTGGSSVSTGGSNGAGGATRGTGGVPGTGGGAEPGGRAGMPGADAAIDQNDAPPSKGKGCAVAAPLPRGGEVRGGIALASLAALAAMLRTRRVSRRKSRMRR